MKRSALKVLGEAKKKGGVGAWGEAQRNKDHDTLKNFMLFIIPDFSLKQSGRFL